MQLPLCACGCGRTVNAPSVRHRTRISRYLKGHGQRGKDWSVKHPPDAPTGMCECGCGERTPICTLTRTERRQYIGHPLPLIPGHKQPKPTHGVRKLPPTEAAYLAGIIDGEGCVHVRKGYRHVNVSVSNTDIHLMAWLRTIGGKALTTTHDRPKQISQKPVFAWSVGNWVDCRDLLRQVLPYMVIKRSRASAALERLDEWLATPRYSRKVKCVAGHTFDAENTAIDKGDRSQRCRACSRERTRRYRERRHLRSREASKHTE